jgi:hypothetical protein
MHRALLIAAFACSAGCLVVSAEVPQICTTQSVSFQGFAGGAAPAAGVAFARELSLPVTMPDLVTHVSIEGGTVSADDNDLSFIAALKIELVPADTSLQPFTLLDYQRGASVPRTIDIPATSRELAAFLNTAGAGLRVTGVAQPPPAGKTLSVELCVDAGVDKTISLTH